MCVLCELDAFFWVFDISQEDRLAGLLGVSTICEATIVVLVVVLIVGGVNIPHMQFCRSSDHTTDEWSVPS